MCAASPPVRLPVWLSAERNLFQTPLWLFFSFLPAQHPQQRCACKLGLSFVRLAVESEPDLTVA